jgi:hypothetical protein
MLNSAMRLLILAALAVLLAIGLARNAGHFLVIDQPEHSDVMSEWSDWNGQRGDSSPTVLEAFVEATQKVQAIGLSFGGECFFETGVTAEYPPGTPPPYEIFSSKFSETAH